MSEEYCFLCNLSFGSAEPRRRRSDGKPVHDRCVLAKNRKQAYVDACVQFLAENVGQDEADAFAQRAKSFASPGHFAALLSRKLRVVWDKSRNPVVRKRFKDFAWDIGGQLTHEVTLPTPTQLKLKVLNSDE